MEPVESRVESTGLAARLSATEGIQVTRTLARTLSRSVTPSIERLEKRGKEATLM
jgi:hypothetical protein